MSFHTHNTLAMDDCFCFKNRHGIGTLTRQVHCTAESGPTGDAACRRATMAIHYHEVISRSIVRYVPVVVLLVYRNRSFLVVAGYTCAHASLSVLGGGVEKT